MPSKNVELGRLPTERMPSYDGTMATRSPDSSAVVIVSVGGDLRALRIRLWKDCLVLSVAWFLLYTGYNSISAVQSSLNSDNGLGVTTMCVEFATMTFGNLFTDSSIMKRLGCKWTIALGMGVYSVYMSANFYPSFYTMVPLAAVSGLTSAAMWVAQSTYLSRIGMAYGERFNLDSDKYKGRFLGILYMAYQISNVVGNLISSLILGSNIDTADSNQFDNDQYTSICGAFYCNQDLDTVFNGGGGSSTSGQFYYNVTGHWNPLALSLAHQQQELQQQQEPLHQLQKMPGRHEVFMFCAFCVTCGVLATVILSLFLDTLPKLDIKEGNDNMTTKQLLLAAVYQWRDFKQILLVPIGLYNGMDNPFWTAEFTKAFITCPIGMHFIGFVMTIYGFTAAIAAVAFGWFSNQRFRMVPFVLAFSAHCAVAISLLYWMPNAHNRNEMFMLSATWGIGSGVWSSQVPIFSSMIFPHNLEAAFSNTRIWDAVGRTMSYAWSYSLCTNYKIYLVILFMSIGIAGLFAIEIQEWVAARLGPSKRKNNDLVVDTSSSSHMPVI